MFILPFNYVSIEPVNPGGWIMTPWNKFAHCCTANPSSRGFMGVLIQSVADGQYDMGATGVTIPKTVKNLSISQMVM
jgi:hypothetical protein